MQMNISIESRRKIALSACVAAASVGLLSGTAWADPKFYAGPDATTNETGTFDNTSTNWNTVSSTTPTTTLLAPDDAIFDQLSTYTVTVANSAANTISVNAGNVTFAGTGTATTGTVSVASGATAILNNANFFKTGTTNLNVDGTLQIVTGGGPAGGRLTLLTGSGLVRPNDSAAVNLQQLRLAGAATAAAGTFAGSVQDNGLGAFQLNLSSAGFVNLTGNNTYSGDTLMSVNGSVLRIGSTTGYSNASRLRFEGGAGNLLVELAAGDFTRTNSNVVGAGGINYTGTNAGFYATGADRNFTIVNSTVDPTPTDLVLGTGVVGATGYAFGSTAATNKVTWTNNLGLGTAAKTFNVADGSAVSELELSGVISSTSTGGGLIKGGLGRMILSNTNTFTGGVTLGANSGFLRLTNGQALGLDATAKTITTTASNLTSVGGVELIGGIAVNNKALNIGGRTVAAANAILINVSGDNAFNGNITIGGGGGGYAFRSDAGTLTLGGTLNNNVAGGARAFNLFGDGNYAITGTVANGAGTATTSLVVRGAGTTTISGTNTSTGGTNVVGGTLVAASTSALGAGNVAVGSDGAVATTGAALQVDAAAPVIVGGLNGLTVNTGNTLGYSAIGDQLALAAGTFVLGDFTLDLNNAFNAEGMYTLIDGVAGANAIGATTFVDADTASFNYSFAVSGDDGVLSVTAVPEPTALALLGVGGLAMLRRRSRIA